MSNLTDLLDSVICVLDNPGEKTLAGAITRFKIEDGLESVSTRDLEDISKNTKITTKSMTPEEKKIARREYFRNYMREYKKTYVQPEHNKSHNAKRRRKYRTALVTSAKIRKNAEKNGYIITKNCYKVKKEQVDETENQVRKPNSPTDI